MKIVNLPKSVTEKWIQSKTHPKSHTIEELLLGVRTLDVARKFFSQQRPQWHNIIVPEDGFHYFFFNFKKVTTVGVYCSHLQHGGHDHSKGVLCDLQSCHGGKRFLFLPLAFRVLPEALHRFGKLCAFGKKRAGGEYWKVESRVMIVDVPPFGAVSLVSVWT